ncbi:hypothetical protein BC828DRAFT_379234 [Blastocladiella britannica]|nr:hypothetical protein BC828DRAFT_379234 [Blastocladiella britannica]
MPIPKPTAYPDDWSYTDFDNPSVVLIMWLCLIFSAGTVGIGAVQWIRLQSLFPAGIVAMALPFTISDTASVLVICRLLPIHTNELFRTMVPCVGLWQLTALSCVRFKVFHRSRLAPYYPPRFSNALIVIVYFMGVAGTAGILYSYILQMNLPLFPPSPLRKGIILFLSVFCVTIDLIIAFLTLRIVWRVRKKAMASTSATATPGGGSEETNGSRIISRSILASLNNAGGGNASSVLLDPASAVTELWGDSLRARGLQAKQSRAAHARRMHVRRVSALAFVLLGFMLTGLFTGAFVFLQSTTLLEDSLAAMSIRMYAMMTVLQWMLVTHLFAK